MKKADVVDMLLRFKEITDDHASCVQPCCCYGDCVGCRLKSVIEEIDVELYSIAPEMRPPSPAAPLPPLPPVITEPTPAGDTLEEWGKDSLAKWEKLKK